MPCSAPINMNTYYHEAVIQDGLLRSLTKLRDDGVIWMKPQTTGTTDREVLPDGDYPFVVTKWAEEALPEWKQQGAVDYWNKNEQERLDKNADYKANFIESYDELPWHKKGEYVFYLQVREGEHKGKSLPCVYLPLRWNTDPKYRDRSRWFLFCKTIVPNLGKRGDVPDLDEEVVGFGATAELEIGTSKRGSQFNKYTGFRKDDSFGKKQTVGAPQKADKDLPVTGEVDADGDELIPF